MLRREMTLRERTAMVAGALLWLGCAGTTPPPGPDAGATAPLPTPLESTKAMPLEIRLTANPGPTLREDQTSGFSLEFVVKNLGAATVDPRLGASILRVNGAPLKDWDMTINNGPRDGRFTALPAGDNLHFGYALGGALFHGPGEYSVTLETGGVMSKPLLIRVLPRGG